MMSIRTGETLCMWLQEQLKPLTCKWYPFDLDEMPDNGIYFFYERGETWGHGGKEPRIVRVGTHRGDGNFRLRIRQHFLHNEQQAMNFDLQKAAPKDHSIFRKNIGRALLNRALSAYLDVWNKDMKRKCNKEAYRTRRDIALELQTEKQITSILRGNFAFRFITIEEKLLRMRLESRIIGTLAACPLCHPSNDWLGKDSPEVAIRNGNLWLVQHIKSEPIDATDMDYIKSAVNSTINRFDHPRPVK